MKNPWVLVSFDVISTMSWTCPQSTKTLRFQLNHPRNRNMSTQSSCSSVPEICCSGREQPPTKCEEKSPASHPMKSLNYFCWFYFGPTYSNVFRLYPMLFCFPPLILNKTPDSHWSKRLLLSSRLRALIAAPSSPRLQNSDQGWILLPFTGSTSKNQHSQGAACGGHGSWVPKSQRTPPAASAAVLESQFLSDTWGLKGKKNLPPIVRVSLELRKILATQIQG